MFQTRCDYFVDHAATIDHLFRPRCDYFVDHATYFATNVSTTPRLIFGPRRYLFFDHAATILSTIPRLMFRPRCDYFVDHAATNVSNTLRLFCRPSRDKYLGHAATYFSTMPRLKFFVDHTPRLIFGPVSTTTDYFVAIPRLMLRPRRDYFVCRCFEHVDQAATNIWATPLILVFRPCRDLSFDHAATTLSTMPLMFLLRRD